MLIRALIFLLMPLTSFAQSPELGIFDRYLSLGDAPTGEPVNYDAETETYRLAGGTYLWTSVQGDFIFRAEVSGPGAGLRLADHLSADAPAFTLEAEDGAGEWFVVEIRREGDTLRTFTAPFGEPLREGAVQTSELRNEPFAGLYLGGDAQVTSFRNVRLSKPAFKDLVPYRDYLPSRLELLDVETGLRTVLLTSDHSLQAPNWTLDGAYLIYNSNGYLYRYRLVDGHVETLNTGFAIRNNNDHVLSFDGTQLGISHHVAEENNASTIFVLPAEGSDEPRRITLPNVGHSYLHGFSPDAKQVVFTGGRNDKYDIYLADVATGEETAVTDTPGLDDGPEFSADGRYIYFNSNRSGMMQLWRVEADGSHPTRLIEDHNYNDWFPHLSPDGEEIIFLSFGTDVESSQHPFYKHVTLRMMPVGGGAPRVVAYLYGGQGTINVPSWSPDGRYVAFVSNTDR